MTKVQINREMQLTYPDGFHEMTDEERSSLLFMENGPGICLSDPKRHMIVSIGYKKAGGLTARMLSQKDVATKSEASIRKPMQQYRYWSAGFMRRLIGGAAADGFGYTYLVQDIGMYGETHILKRGKVFYYFHVYMRSALQEESMPVWEQLLADVVWAD